LNKVPLSVPVLSLPVDTRLPMMFYRARTFAADPPRVEIWHPE
jgi:hypothetical protein